MVYLSSSLHGLCSDWLRFVLLREMAALPFSHKSALFAVDVATPESKGELDSVMSGSSSLETERLCNSCNMRERESVCVC